MKPSTRAAALMSGTCFEHNHSKWTALCEVHTLCGFLVGAVSATARDRTKRRKIAQLPSCNSPYGQIYGQCLKIGNSKNGNSVFSLMSFGKKLKKLVTL